jgi:hypothetical protein
LDGVSDKIATAVGEDVKERAVKEGEALFGKTLTDSLMDTMGKLHLGSRVGAALLLERIFPLLAVLERIVPDFVHEGRHFAANILLGLKYHEQVLGEQLGSVQSFLRDLKKLPLQLKGEQQLPNDVSLLRVLVKSCYSILDWDGVALFGLLLPDVNKKVKLCSFLQLPRDVRNVPPSEFYRDLTKTHSGLFAINIDRGGCLRIFYGGTLLLYKQKGTWKLGSDVKALSEMLATKLQRIAQKKIENTDFLNSFVDLLLRISEEPGLGALFVIATDQSQVDRLSYIAEPPKEIWKDLNPFGAKPGISERDLEVLYRLSIMDGATVIRLGNHESLETQWREAKIFPRRLITERFDLDKFWEQQINKTNWERWTDILSYGSKHSAAFALAMQTADLPNNRPLIITVSSDGPISFMIGNENPPVVRWPGD